MDKTRKSTSSKNWPYSTCAISVWRTGQILLVVDFLVLSTTILNHLMTMADCRAKVYPTDLSVCLAREAENDDMTSHARKPCNCPLR